LRMCVVGQAGCERTCWIVAGVWRARCSLWSVSCPSESAAAGGGGGGVRACQWRLLVQPCSNAVLATGVPPCGALVRAAASGTVPPGARALAVACDILPGWLAVLACVAFGARAKSVSRRLLRHECLLRMVLAQHQPECATHNGMWWLRRKCGATSERACLSHQSAAGSKQQCGLWWRRNEMPRELAVIRVLSHGV
jgi:hypothetical protein